MNSSISSLAHRQGPQSLSWDHGSRRGNLRYNAWGSNILASCVNSTGTTACNALFTAATPSGGATPTNTLDAALDIALNPTNNVGVLFALPTPSAPFGPTLSSAPANWTFGNAITTNPVPAISNLSPSSLAVGSASQTLTLNGTGFLRIFQQ